MAQPDAKDNGKVDQSANDIDRETARYKVKTTVEFVEEVVAYNSFEAEMKAKSVREHESPAAQSVDSETLREVDDDA